MSGGPSPSGRLRIACLLLSPLARDARVIKQATALAEAGHEVTVIAPAPAPEAAAFRIETLPAEPRPSLRRLALVAGQAPATLLPVLAPALFWLGPRRRALFARALALRPDVVIANDVLTLPVGAALKRRQGCRLIYDSHELAASEHAQNWKWRLVSQRFVREIERRAIAAADGVMTVGGRLAEALAASYGLVRRPCVVRNLPPRIAVAPRRAGAPRTILFHGLIRHERGLESLIASLPLWRFDGRAIVRGYGAEPYIAALRAQAQTLGVADRLAFAPPLPPDELVAAAATADIGYLMLPAGAPQYEAALPNKLFEYLAAGLAVLAAPRAEISATLAPLGAGRFAEDDPAAIAAALNAIDDPALAAMREAAREAAATLNWETERRTLVDFVETVAGAPR